MTIELEQTQSITSALIKNDYLSFLQKCFYTTNPATKFLYNWHLKLIADRLNDCEQGKIRRLIINIPPRYMKSLCVTVAWPAWLLAHNPARRIITASYSQQLSLKHALDTRLIINSVWYKKLFPNVIISADQNEKSKFITTERGYRLATSTEGTLTGEGGNFLILDDPHNPVNIFSKKERDNIINWYNQVFATRLDDKQNGVIVIVMQRLHNEDLCGYLANKNFAGWRWLSIPAIENNKALHEARESFTYLQQLQNELGSYVFSAQYLQKPIPEQGGMINPKWLKYYDTAPVKDDIQLIIQSWDTAIKSGINSDYSVCSTWALTKDNKNYLLDIFRAKAEYPELKKQIITLAEKYHPNAILIEDKASGQSLLQDLKTNSQTALPLIPIMPKFDKVTRAAKASVMIESGLVYVPAFKTHWQADFEFELYTFPNSSHDDIVDSISQYLNWVQNRRDASNNMRRL